MEPGGDVEQRFVDGAFLGEADSFEGEGVDETVDDAGDQAVSTPLARIG
jgi:hypothetical protein